MATKKKTTATDGKRRYVAFRRITSADGSEVWDVGSEIWMDEAQARIHLAKGSVVRPEDTEELAEPEPTVTVHKAKYVITDAPPPDEVTPQPPPVVTEKVEGGE